MVLFKKIPSIFTIFSFQIRSCYAVLFAVLLTISDYTNCVGVISILAVGPGQTLCVHVHIFPFACVPLHNPVHDIGECPYSFHANPVAKQNIKRVVNYCADPSMKK